jgi:hypothetical protein
VALNAEVLSTIKIAEEGLQSKNKIKINHV